MAQAIEHELDHLDGVLFVDRVKEGDKLFEVDAEGNEEMHSGQDYSSM